MGFFARKAIFPLAFVLIFISCSHVRTRYVTIQYAAAPVQKAGEHQFAKLTVNDFTDKRDDTKIVGIDYTKAADILSIEPVGISVAQVIGSVLQEKGFEVVRISRQERPADYGPEYEAEYHLTGAIEELTMKVKGKGLLSTFDSSGRIHFSLYNGVGKVVWAGRMRAESSTSSPFVTDKAIEKSINECVRLLGEALATDGKFIEITAKR